MAHSVVTIMEGVEYINITFTGVKINAGLEDSLFKMN